MQSLWHPRTANSSDEIHVLHLQNECRDSRRCQKPFSSGTPPVGSPNLHEHICSHHPDNGAADHSSDVGSVIPGEVRNGHAWSAVWSTVTLVQVTLTVCSVDRCILRSIAMLRTRKTGLALRRILVESFGTLLAPLGTVLPPSPTKYEDTPESKFVRRQSVVD